MAKQLQFPALRYVDLQKCLTKKKKKKGKDQNYFLILLLNQCGEKYDRKCI